MENAFGGLISRLDPAKNPSLRRLIKTSKTENQRGKKKKKDCKISKLGQNVQELCNNYKKCNIHLMEIPER